MKYFSYLYNEQNIRKMENVKNNLKASVTRDFGRNYIVKLERYSKDLAQLDSKLNSYMCEPKTYELFERKNSLKKRMDRLRRSNQELIKNLKEKKGMVSAQIEQIKELYSDFINLQTELRDYYTVVNSH